MIIKKQWNHKNTAILGLSILFVLLISSAIADEATYFYDDNGRLVTVTNVANNTRALYQYDEVGNLIAIFNETSIPQALPPVLQSIDPDIFLIGETYNVLITGENLLTTQSVTSDNPDVTVRFIAAIDTKIIATITITDATLPGQTNLTVTTQYGSASIAINLHGINMTPKEALSFPSMTLPFSAGLTPPAASDITVKVNNENPDIIDTEPVITIPAGGNTNFDVLTLKPGTGIIKIGNGMAIIEVIGNFYDAKPVSVEIAYPSTGESSVSSNPVSVAISINSSDFTTLESSPVSVTINNSSTDFATVASMPVSVNIGGTFDVATSESAPVSVSIETSSTGESSVSSNPVSVAISINSSDFTTLESSPVSVTISGSSTDFTTIGSTPVSVIMQLPQTAYATTVSQPVAIGWCTNLPVRVVGSTTTYYSTLQDAYNAASSGDIIQSQFGELTGDLTINDISNKSVTFEGGYNCNYTGIAGFTAIKGQITTSRGIITIKNFILKK